MLKRKGLWRVPRKIRTRTHAHARAMDCGASSSSSTHSAPSSSFYESRKRIASPGYTARSLHAVDDEGAAADVQQGRERKVAVCTMKQAGSKNNPNACFMLPRGVYKGKTWEQRVKDKRNGRQLVPVSDYLQDRDWASEDEVFAGSFLPRAHGAAWQPAAAEMFLFFGKQTSAGGRRRHPAARCAPRARPSTSSRSASRA